MLTGRRDAVWKDGVWMENKFTDETYDLPATDGPPNNTMHSAIAS